MSHTLYYFLIMFWQGYQPAGYICAGMFVKVCIYFYILRRHEIFAQLPENIKHMGKYSTL